MTRRPETERTQIVWVVWNESNGKYRVLDSIYEDPAEALQFINARPHMRGESWALIRKDRSDEEKHNRIMNELAGHEEAASS